MARQQLTFLLRRQKKSKPKKRRPDGLGSFWGQSPNSPSLWPALRVRCIAPQRNGRLTPITQPAVLNKNGIRHKLGYRLKQVPALFRFCLRSSAQPDGVGDEHKYGETMTRFARHGLRAGCVSFPRPDTDCRQPSRQHHSLMRLNEVSAALPSRISGIRCGVWCLHLYLYKFRGMSCIANE